MLSKLATRGLLPNARWARCLSAHRAAVHLRLLVGGEDRLPGAAANQMAAPQRHDSNVNQKRRVRRMRCRQRLRCPQRPCRLRRMPAAGLWDEGTQPEGSANPNPAPAYSAGS